MYKVVFACLVFLPLSSFSADVFIQKNIAGLKELAIEGEIKKGDLEKIIELSPEVVQGLLFTRLNFTINVNSQGGDIEEAIKIGGFARDLLATVRVNGTVIREDDGFVSRERKANPNSSFIWQYHRFRSRYDDLKEGDITRCYSACILIFYGGVERSFSDNEDQRVGGIPGKAIPVIGLHRPYYDKGFFGDLSPSEAQEKYRTLESKVKGYLLEMGAPESLISRMLKSSSNEVDLVKKEDFAQYYDEVSPFYEEWLLAKCGSSDPENILSKRELKIHNQYWVQFKKDLGRHLDLHGEAPLDWGDNYDPPEFPRKTMDSIFRKIKQKSKDVQPCKQKARYSHQIKMISNLQPRN